MPRVMRRGTNFPQLGGEGEQYHVTERGTGQPKFTEAGNPELAWKFPYTSSLAEGSPEHIAATANFLHSIRSAPESTVKAGLDWYPKVSDAVSKGIRTRGFLAGQSDKHLAGSALVAAVSPNMDWETSNIHAFSELRGLKSHQWDTIMGAREGDERSQQAAKDVVSGMSISRAPIRNLQKAGRVIRGEDPNQVLNYASAPKTHSFMHNIHDPDNPSFVTIDARAFDTMTNRLRPWEVNRGIGGASTNKTPPRRYTNAGQVIRGVAQGMGISPSSAQAISWEHTRYNLEQGGGTRKQGPTRVGQPYFHPTTGAVALHLPHLAGQFAGHA